MILFSVHRYEDDAWKCVQFLLICCAKRRGAEKRKEKKIWIVWLYLQAFLNHIKHIDDMSVLSARRQPTRAFVKWISEFCWWLTAMNCRFTSQCTHCLELKLRFIQLLNTINLSIPISEDHVRLSILWSWANAQAKAQIFT